jgi:hypothetical protein
MGANINVNNLDMNLDKFSVFYVGLLVCAAIFPVLLMKHVNFLIKMNGYSIYIVSLLIGFLFYQGFYSLFTTKFDFHYIKNTTSEPRHLYLFGEDPCTLMGAMSLGFFSHSIILPIMKNNQNQENNRRDLFIGYMLVGVTYCVLGIIGYIGFSGSSFKPEFQDVKNNKF